MLGTGLGIGLGLSEAPVGSSTGPVPPRPTEVTAIWDAGIPQAVQKHVTRYGHDAVRLATAIDMAPSVSRTCSCPVPSELPTVSLSFSYSPTSPVVGVIVWLTGCPLAFVGPPVQGQSIQLVGPEVRSDLLTKESERRVLVRL